MWLSQDKKTLNIANWVLAVNKMAIAAEAVGMWTVCAAQAHIEICLQVAGGTSLFCFCLLVDVPYLCSTSHT